MDRGAEIDAGKRPGVTSDQAAELAALRKENAELRRANDILKTASAFFAQAELDRRPSDRGTHRHVPGPVRVVPST